MWVLHNKVLLAIFGRVAHHRREPLPQRIPIFRERFGRAAIRMEADLFDEYVSTVIGR